MKNIIAFADEYGNNSFEFSSQGTHFIVASVILKKEKLAETEAYLESIRKKHFQTGEIKSRKIGDQHHRRLKILQDLIQADFSVYAVVVNKRKLIGEGFKHKPSFYKFLNGLVYKELFKTFPELDLVVDEHGDNDFMRQFKRYVQRYHQPNLFSGSDFQFAGSAESIMIQLADFIAGTLGRCFDENKISAESQQFLQVLEPKITSLNFFPYDQQHLLQVEQEQEAGFDEDIARIGVNSAIHFIDTKKVLTQDDADQVNCVKLMLLYFNTYGTKKYIQTRQLIQHLQVGREELLTEHNFRTKVIGKIRDAGVLIVSSSAGEHKGYKLPASLADLHKFVSHGNSVIMPMLHRIAVFRNKIKLATLNDIDILDTDEFRGLKELLV
jgi:disulfide oxidoreductase YuzD